jgi:hypothetical protein
MLLYKPIKYTCKMHFVQRSYASALQFVCVITGVTHAPEYIMKLMHIVNLLARLVLLSVAVALVETRGCPCAPGVAVEPYQESDWDDLTQTDWVNGTLPGMKMILRPGNAVIITLWFSIVAYLITTDTLRCLLVLNGTWYSRENHADMVWSILSCMIIPLLFSLVAVQLGTHDALTTTLVAFIACTSGICGAISEHMRTLINPQNTKGMSDTVLWMLRVAQEMMIVVATNVTLIPMLSNLMYHGADPSSTARIVLSALFSGFVYTLAITNYRHNRLCSIFEETWLQKTSMVPWGVDTGLSNKDSPLQSGESCAPHAFPGMYTTTKLPTTSEDGTYDPFDPQTSEEAFNQLYGCHIYRSDPSASIIHIVDQDHKVTSVELKESFNMYNQLYSAEAISRDGVLASGAHFAQVGAPSQLFHAHIDHDGSITRKMIGVLTEWRRYYLVNAFINALLFTSLLNITGVMGVCVV